MNYQIVKDYQELGKFIDWLPDLDSNEKYYYCLMARKKYGATDGLKSDKQLLKRGTATKETLLSNLKKLEVEVGSYTVDGLQINQDSLVTYISPNPRDLHKAGILLLRDMADKLVKNEPISPHSMALNRIQTTGRKIFFDIDVDFKEGHSIEPIEMLELIDNENIINQQAIQDILVTRGGLHILVRLDKIVSQFKSKWYNRLVNLSSSKFDVTMNGDNMIPIAGCVQGDTFPKFW